MSTTSHSWVHEYRTLLCGLFTVGCSLVTGWAIIDEQARVTVVLLGVLTLYGLVSTLPVVQRRVPRIDRLAAVPLGIIGVLAYFGDAPTDLPIFFMFLGIGSVIDLLWDPTGTVYKDRAE